MSAGEISDRPAHFTVIDGGYLPTPHANSHWGENHLNGPAVVGLAARHLEHDCGAPDFLPTRLTVDLFRAARQVPTTVEVRVVREGRRVRNAECDVIQDGRPVARATLVQYRRAAPPPGEVWTAGQQFDIPDTDGFDYGRIGSEAAGWSPTSSDHQNASRKRYYSKPLEVISGQPNSPFVRAVMAAEATSLVTNLSTRGVGYINGDVTVGLTRLPADEWIGLQGDSHVSADGIAVGTTSLFDSAGIFGTAMTTAVSNAEAQIDLARPLPFLR